MVSTPSLYTGDNLGIAVVCGIPVRAVVIARPHVVGIIRAVVGEISAGGHQRLGGDFALCGYGDVYQQWRFGRLCEAAHKHLLAYCRRDVVVCHHLHARREFAHIGGHDAERVVAREVGIVVSLAVDQRVWRAAAHKSQQGNQAQNLFHIVGVKTLNCEVRIPQTSQL